MQQTAMQDKEKISFQSITVAGLGLMGASLARAVKDVSPTCCYGIDIAPETIKRAKESHVIEDGCILSSEDEKIPDLLSRSELLVLAMYPSGIIPFLEKFREDLPKGMIVIDICGLKQGVVAKAQELMPESVEYLGTHPMAGKEKSGFEFGNGDIFLGSSFILTPTEKNTLKTIHRIEELARSIGCGRIRKITPKEHDRMIAYTSHLPHIAAASIIRSFDGANGEDSDDIASYAGGSFRDTTRVAEINSDLWAELFLTNREELLKTLNRYSREIKAFENALKNEDEEALRQMLRESSKRKTDWNQRRDRYNG